MSRMPVIYLPHGGGPWPFVDLGMPKAELDALAAYLRDIPSTLPHRPRALLVISAHWEATRPTVTTSPQPPLLFDYYGFPPAAYKLTWPAPGDPPLAARVRALVEQAGFEAGADAERGFDHGTFVPLKLAFPDADVPTVQLSLIAGLDPATHIALGRALAPLRDDGVLILGSGMSFHNMRAFRDSQAARLPSAEFDAWLQRAAAAAARDAALAAWEGAPMARFAHPREEHLLPLMVVAGAALDDAGRVAFSGNVLGAKVSALHFG